MRWFKHMIDSSDDERLAQLLAECGLEGYGLWWLYLEAVAKQTTKSNESCQVSYPVSYWMRKTGFYHVKKLRILTECMVNLGLISAQSSNYLGSISSLSLSDVLTISIPNILKYRDEYSKKSGHSPDKLRTDSGVKNIDTETDTETEKKDKTFVGLTPDDPPPEQIYEAVINHLNRMAGTQYRAKSKSTRALINGRIGEGYTLPDFKAVIDSKAREWGRNPKMIEYLRPETLFCATKFEGYLQSARREEQQIGNDRRTGAGVDTPKTSRSQSEYAGVRVEHYDPTAEAGTADLPGVRDGDRT